MYINLIKKCLQSAPPTLHLTKCTLHLSHFTKVLYSAHCTTHLAPSLPRGGEISVSKNRVDGGVRELGIGGGDLEIYYAIISDVIYLLPTCSLSKRVI